MASAVVLNEERPESAAGGVGGSCGAGYERVVVVQVRGGEEWGGEGLEGRVVRVGEWVGGG